MWEKAAAVVTEALMKSELTGGRGGKGREGKGSPFTRKPFLYVHVRYGPMRHLPVHAVIVAGERR